MFESEEDAIKYFEEYYEQIKAKRLKLNVYRPRKPASEQDNELDYKPVESLVNDDWILDKDNAQRFFKDMDLNLTRYPHGFRHFESFANYKLHKKDAEVQDYIQVMNEQCEFETFLAVQRA
jgi:hypothetical protein